LEVEVRLGCEGKEKGCSGIHKGMWFGISSILAVETAVVMAVAMVVGRAVTRVLVLVLIRVPAVIEVEGSSQ
jgi:hypothetical protein